MNGLFVTGSGTGVGKTHVLCGLVGELVARGATPRVMKPLVTGFDPDAPETSDTGALLAALGRALDARSIESVSPWRFAAALSPDRAALREGRAVDFAQLVAACRPRPDDGPLLIEGIGGVMVPVDDAHTVLDWIAALRMPALLVTGSYLGSLSHALTAAFALRARGVPLAAIVVSESAEPALGLDEQRSTLARFVAPAPVLTWARGAARSEPPILDVVGARLGA